MACRLTVELRSIHIGNENSDTTVLYYTRIDSFTFTLNDAKSKVQNYCSHTGQCH